MIKTLNIQDITEKDIEIVIQDFKDIAIDNNYPLEEEHLEELSKSSYFQEFINAIMLASILRKLSGKSDCIEMIFIASFFLGFNTCKKLIETKELEKTNENL